MSAPFVHPAHEPVARAATGFARAHADLVAHQLLELARAGSAVLVATHDPRLVSEADRVVHLHAGRHRGSPVA